MTKEFRLKGPQVSQTLKQCLGREGMRRGNIFIYRSEGGASFQEGGASFQAIVVVVSRQFTKKGIKEGRSLKPTSVGSGW